MSMPRTVLHFSSSSGPGGAETIVAKLASSLDPHRFRSVVCLFRRGWLYDACRDHGIQTEVVPIRGALDLGWVRSFGALLRREEVAIVHAHEFSANVYGTAVARLLRIPAITTVHGKSYYADRLRRRLAYRYVGRASRMVAVSADLKQFLVNRVGVTADRVNVIYNGLDIDSSPAACSGDTVRADLRTEGYDHVIGAVGSLYPVKGHIHLVRALPAILQRCPRTLLLLIGRGELEQALRQEVARLKLDAHVRFLGFRRDVPLLLSALEVFVLPSLSEGLSMAMLEAMAAGKPVVATRVGGNPELVLDGESGYLVDAESPQALADKVVRLLQDRELANRMGVRGRLRVREKFTLRTMVDAYQRLYESPTGHQTAP